MPTRLSRLLLVAAVSTATALAAAAPALAHTSGVRASVLDDQQNACPDSRVGHGLLDPGFVDIDRSIFKRQIKCIWAYTITAGKDTTHYAPEEPVLRMQMAVYIWNFLDGLGVAPTDNGSHGFTDLDGLPTTIEDAINELANAGIVSGFDSTHYRPSAVVLRDQMAKFINSAQRYADARVPTGTGFGRTDGRRGYPAGPDYFDDDNRDVFQSDINAIAQAGITAGASPSKPFVYDPGAPVLRGQMAAFLARDLEANILDYNLFTSVFSQDQTFIARPGGDVTAPVGGSVPLAFYVSPGTATPTNAALVPCGQVHNGSATGDLYADTFTDANGDRKADGLGSTDAGSASFTGGAKAQAVTVSSSAVSLTVTSAAPDCAVVVVFADQDGDGQLAIDGNNQAAEPYAATAEVRFVSTS